MIQVSIFLRPVKWRLPCCHKLFGCTELVGYNQTHESFLLVTTIQIFYSHCLFAYNSRSTQENRQKTFTSTLTSECNAIIRVSIMVSCPSLECKYNIAISCGNYESQVLPSVLSKLSPVVEHAKLNK